MERNEFESYVRAGEIASKVRKFAKTFIKKGMKLIDIANAIDEKIIELGGNSAFPVNLSINEIAAHYTPEPEDEEIAEGILKIDLGVEIEGYIADCAFSMDLTDSKEFEEMISFNNELLKTASEIVKPEMKVRDVGSAIQKKFKEINGEEGKFSIIKGLSGHSLGKNKIHAGLTISNYENENKSELKNIAFAIEPFLTSGNGEIYEGKPGGIYVLENDVPIRDSRARELLTFIRDKYKTRPFCRRWLEKEGFKNIGRLLDLLVKQKVLHSFALLIEKSKAPVSQAEDSFIIYNGETRRLTR